MDVVLVSSVYTSSSVLQPLHGCDPQASSPFLDMASHNFTQCDKQFTVTIRNYLLATYIPAQKFPLFERKTVNLQSLKSMVVLAMDLRTSITSNPQSETLGLHRMCLYFSCSLIVNHTPRS